MPFTLLSTVYPQDKFDSRVPGAPLITRPGVFVDTTLVAPILASAVVSGIGVAEGITSDTIPPESVAGYVGRNLLGPPTTGGPWRYGSIADDDTGAIFQYRAPTPPATSGSWLWIGNVISYGVPGPSGSSAAPAWAANTSYLASQIVVQANTLYRAKVNFTSGATFSAANWDQLGASLDTAGRVIQSPKTLQAFGIFTPADYGAVGDNGNDDTASFQAMFTAAIAAKGRVYIPRAPAYWKLSSTVTLQPASGAQFNLDIESNGGFDNIQWAGGSNTSIFRTLGWKRSKMQGVQARIATAVSNVVVWDIDGIAGSYGSSAQLSLWGNHITFTSAPSNCHGWRIGHSSDDTVDFSYIDWHNCTVFSTVGALAGHVGWRIESANSLDFQWFGGGGQYLTVGVTTDAGTGAVGTSGGPTMFFYGFGNTNCATDFAFHAYGTYVITGGRSEVGQRFLDIGQQGQGGADVHVMGHTLAAYAPSDGIIFNVQGGSSLILDACEVRPASAAADYTSAMVTLSGPSTARGTFIARACKVRAADPFFTVTTAAARWNVEINGCRKTNSANATTATFLRYVISTADSNDLMVLSNGDGGASFPAYYAGQRARDGSGAVRFRIGFDTIGTVLSDAGGNRPVAMQSGSSNRKLVQADPSGNVVLGGSSSPASGAAAFGSAVGAVLLTNAATVPTANPSAGSLFYSDSGHPKLLHSDGTLTDFTKVTVTGSRSGNAGLASLLTGLASRGYITDNTTA